eukprot:SAG31_NODE_4478_length_3200_cov_7.008062_3_plen_190_part_00
MQRTNRESINHVGLLDFRPILWCVNFVPIAASVQSVRAGHSSRLLMICAGTFAMMKQMGLHREIAAALQNSKILSSTVHTSQRQRAAVAAVVDAGLCGGGAGVAGFAVNFAYSSLVDSGQRPAVVHTAGRAGFGSFLQLSRQLAWPAFSAFASSATSFAAIEGLLMGINRYLLLDKTEPTTQKELKCAA